MIISCDNQVININDYGYYLMVHLFHIKWKVYIKYLESTCDKI
jgi:hypothetical protein